MPGHTRTDAETREMYAMMTRGMFLIAFLTGMVCFAGCAHGQAEGEAVGESFYFPGAAHDPAIPTVRDILGFDAGDRAAWHGEMQRYLEAMDSASDRVRLVQHATSHEGRALWHMIITSEKNMDRLDEIREGLGKLADPRLLRNAREGERLAKNLPAVAWLAYSIHGDEMSGSDAALAVAHHLASSTDDDVLKMLDELVVIIDPIMNPDGKDRWVKQIQQHRGDSADADDQSMLHSGHWPWGRTNHYLFDLNRDWILGVHPETRGRIGAVRDWHPMLFVDSHEMGSQDTFLFSPSREPVNPNLPKRRLHWWEVFANDHASAFDEFGWRYYTGEWNEEWYPGYSSSWAGFRGAVGILYEQASIGDQSVRRPEGTELSYRDSVRHQVVSSMSNLRTLRAHREEMLREFVAERREAVSDDGPFAGRVWAVVPTGNASRLRGFVGHMVLQGFEVYSADKEFDASGKDQIGREIQEKTFPAGTVLIPNRQPEGALAAAMLEFDPRMSTEFLQKERRELLRVGGSLLYDTTAWSNTMLTDLEAYELEMEKLPRGERILEMRAERADGLGSASAVAFVVDGADDASLAAAAKLMEGGAEVRVADKKFAIRDRAFSRGSIVVTREDNPGEWERDGLVWRGVCDGVGVALIPIETGLGAGDENPDLGGEHFVRMELPRIALLTRGRISPYSYGAAWHALDKRVGVVTSHIDVETSQFADLRRYNVLILPNSNGEALGGAQRESIERWVRAGGTLIAIGGSAGRLSREEDGMGSVRTLGDSLGELDGYEIEILREWEGRTAEIDEGAVWSHAASTAGVVVAAAVPERADEEMLEREDERARLFMPQGAILAARTDDRHWLTFGLRGTLPVLYTGRTVLMSRAPVETAARFGVYSLAEVVEEVGEGDEEETLVRAGWAANPEGMESRLRMSGLLWPEASGRLANSAYATREGMGMGQVILFASDPVFRGATMGTGRMFLNAAVLGPGMGARHPILP